MTAHAADDFSVLDKHKHMFFDVREPCQYIRDQTEACIQGQKADAILVSLRAFGTPRFLTILREGANEDLMLVTHCGICFRAKLSIMHGGVSAADVDATLTFLFGDIHLRGAKKTLDYFDFGADAEIAFREEEFERRFMEFRIEQCEPPPVASAPARRPWWKLW